METCENLRTLNASGLNPKSSMGSGGSYGFVEKVVDGITVTVNSVLVILHSHVFTASFQVCMGTLTEACGHSDNWLQ